MRTTIIRTSSGVPPTATAVVLSIALLDIFECPAWGFDGTALTGYGGQAAGMGGVSIAAPQDSVAAANNPAGMALVGTRADLNVHGIGAIESMQFAFPGNNLNNTVLVPVPDGGFNLSLGNGISAGMSVFGSGLISNYARPLLEIPNALNALAKLTDYVVAPTIAYRINGSNAIGVSIVGALQGIRAQGILVPSPSGIQQLPTHSTEFSTGYGIRLGYIYSPTDWISFGVKYDSTIRFSKVSGYGQDLLQASGGELDFPWVAGLGVSVRPLTALTVGADYLRYAWHDVSALGNPVGFHWHDQNVLRVGAAYDLQPWATVRVGYSHGSKIIDSDHVAQNVLTAGALAQDAVTAGATFTALSGTQIHIAYEHDFAKSLAGTGESAGTNIKFAADVVTVGYSFHF